MSVCDVSVVIPNYNRTTVLYRALRSVANQTCRPLEVIVIDDHSDPDKLEEIRYIVDQFRDFEITLLVNERNLGANYCRNRGLFAASGAYIAFLDSDDLWMPEKLERQMTEIIRSKASDSRPILCGTGRYRVNGDGEIIARQFSGRLMSAENIRQSNFIGTLSSVIVETSIARYIRGFSEALPACQDWDFFIRLADYVQYVSVSDPLCIYVDHDDERITLNNRKRLQAHLCIYKKHIKHFKNVSRFSRAEFYRNVAEDYQAMGKVRKANIFYAKHLSLRRAGLSSYLIPSGFWFWLYRIHNAPLIKAQRYAAYKRSLDRAIRTNTVQRQRTLRDGDYIKRIMLNRPGFAGGSNSSF
jgi:glycosyltransferase involved in cell wall biosynthesis